MFTFVVLKLIDMKKYAAIAFALGLLASEPLEIREEVIRQIENMESNNEAFSEEIVHNLSSYHTDEYYFNLLTK